MPDKETRKRARVAAHQGKAPSTQAGEFVREEIEYIREGKHGARSAKQAIAIGLSKARRAGVRLPPPKKGKTSRASHTNAIRDYRRGQTSSNYTSPTRSRATLEALQREGESAASPQALSRQARASAKRRGAASLHSAAIKAVHTKGKKGLRRAAQKAARTRALHRKAA